MKGFVIAKETVVEVSGERPDLGYTLYPKSQIFESSVEAMNVLIKAEAPLGWIVISLSELFK